MQRDARTMRVSKRLTSDLLFLEKHENEPVPETPDSHILEAGEARTLLPISIPGTEHGEILDKLGYSAAARFVCGSRPCRTRLGGRVKLCDLHTDGAPEHRRTALQARVKLCDPNPKGGLIQALSTVFTRHGIRQACVGTAMSEDHDVRVASTDKNICQL